MLIFSSKCMGSDISTADVSAVDDFGWCYERLIVSKIAGNRN